MMNRRSLLSVLVGLPAAIGAALRASDGVALWNVAHPVGAAPVPEDIGGIMGAEIDLPVYAYKGERVTCENGHHICTFRRTVWQGQSQNLPDDFCDWQQEEPKIGQYPLPRCAVCDAEFTGGCIYHVEGAWRDPLDMLPRLRSRA